jgi:hypothetical protein
MLGRFERAVAHVLHQLPEGVPGGHEEAGVRVAALVQRNRLEGRGRPARPAPLGDRRPPASTRAALGLLDDQAVAVELDVGPIEPFDFRSPKTRVPIS